MRTLSKFLTLLLCLELIVSPIAPNLSVLSLSDARAEDCPTGFTFDSILNRCLTKTETANVMNATMSCGNDVACYKENAQKAFQDKVNAGEAPERKKDGFVSTVGGIMAVAVPVTIATAAIATNSSGCFSGSFWAMVAGAVAVFAGDTMANMQHKSRLKKIKEEWGKIVNPEQANGDKDKERETSIEAQSQAFEMLARAEDSLAKAAKTKKTFYMIGALAYGAATAMSIMEIISSNAPATAAVERPRNTCAPTTTSVTKERESLYSYYSSPSSMPIFDNSQFIYNIENSKDLTALIVNKAAMSESLSSPSIEEYEKFQTAFNTPELNEPEIFEGLKAVTANVLRNMNIISTAHAVEQEAVSSVESPTSASSSSSSDNVAGSTSVNSSTKVNTNAAKAFKEDEGKGFDIMKLVAGIGVGAGIGFALKKQLITPEGRAIASGVVMGMSITMAMHAGSQAKASEKRAELLRKMKDEFASASGAVFNCKSEDRNDPAKPNCYCYTSENQKNSNRGNSQICQKLWAGVNTNATNYLASAGSTKVCVNQNRQADASCACRSTNTCMKVSLNSVKGLGLGSMGVIGGAIAPANAVLGGAVDGASIGDADLTNKAAKVNALVKKLETAKGTGDFAKTKDKKAAALTTSLNNAAAGLNSNGLLGSSGSSGMPSNPGEAARMLDKEIADQTAPTVGGAQEIATGGDSSPKEDPLEFGLSGDQLAAQEGQIAEVMKQDLDYGGNDINQGSKTNIFEVLSNRYQRSGMRRLFDEKGVTKPEAAAKTDITQ